MAIVNEIINDQYDLEESISFQDNDLKKEHLLEKYLDSRENGSKDNLQVLFKGYDFLNTSNKFDLSHLQGRIIVLDFFTYCCINCMHILPILHELEDKYKDSRDLLVLGVHSAKFQNEKNLDNLKNAIERYNIQHPVVNDPDASLWNHYGVQCWPTLLIFGPSGNLLFQFIGETSRQKLFQYCNKLVKYYQSKKALKHPSLHLSPQKFDKSGILNFPGKIAVSPNEDCLAIADSANHRIVIIYLKTSEIKHIIGGSEFGNINGDFHKSRFNSPQGIAWYSSKVLYIADTNNHCIKKIDIENRQVCTIVGTGVQGNDCEGGKIGLEQEISSPWDLCFTSAEKKLLFIAMAGTHQIWVLFLEEMAWIDKQVYKNGTCKAFVGSGTEGNRNNSYPQSATLAQPSGLTFSVKYSSLYFADSESSCIRSASLDRGAVKNVVGGDIDPTNLFSFGDIDDKGISAKLQHPLGVSWSFDENLLYVADSYNHKIKVINVESRQCSTLNIKAKLDEPGDVCVTPSGQFLFVADTNNHRIVVVSLKTLECTELNIKMEENDSHRENSYKPSDEGFSPDIIIDHGPLCLKSNCSIKVSYRINESPGIQFNEHAPNCWKIECSGDVELKVKELGQGSVESNTGVVSIELEHLGSGIIKLLFSLYGCNVKNGQCFIRTIMHVIKLNESGSEVEELDVNCQLNDS